jgi:hypothetical protein
MTQQPNPLELAKQGNPQAIASLLNRNLQPKGITVKVASKPGGVLQILLEAAQAPDAKEMSAFIQQGMAKLQPAGVRSLVIFSKSTGEDIPNWSREIVLGAPVAEPVDKTPPPSPAPKPAKASSPAPKPVVKKPMPLGTKLLVAGAIAFWPVMFILANLPSEKPTAKTAQTTAPAAAPAPSPEETITPGKYTIKDGYIATLTKDDFDEAIGYIVKKDEAALQEMMNQSRAFQLKTGLVVYLEKCEGFACSTVKIRPEGKTMSFYTNREALEETK